MMVLKGWLGIVMERRILKKNGAIASLTFGAERKFGFKHKQTKEVVSLILQHGFIVSNER